VAVVRHHVSAPPRFDADGKKTENARFIKVIHNGTVVHENVEVTGTTRAGAWEDGEGPRADHAPGGPRPRRLSQPPHPPVN
jgi:hypothetical protein